MNSGIRLGAEPDQCGSIAELLEEKDARFSKKLYRSAPETAS
jgi:hypothetical protein